ncbi:pyridine nucleotide-disulfide oxidoreductase [Parashewanella curva]|uniref:Pyridine nucleotide-disulfide oxidoreductase n=1 Tax=Parashewanella curva TaxID=2338552 RepID=A0A3L8PUY4_9GAMM|nr:FAD-dependent oxidoreductase [Parashewanella curva]RLV59227.1 pyridine nucleotide-disulfide oxidoreductase [Parashewanella curva]
MRSYSWCVVGSGPAGIAAVGNLIDSGVPADDIAWVDPHFSVGDIGDKWFRVQGNSKVKGFMAFFNECASFRFHQAPLFKIHSIDPERSCRLCHLLPPLEWITEQLLSQVTSFKMKVNKISRTHGKWCLTGNELDIQASKVVLATGSEPKTLPLTIPTIPLNEALNDKIIRSKNLVDETIAVFGSSHSAMVALENLMNTQVKKVINFYRSPTKYAVYMDDYVLFDNTGLKEHAALWAKTNIDGTLPDRLERVYCEGDHWNEKIDQCTKAVFCIGFEARTDIQISDIQQPLSYNPYNGIIAHGLFGVGVGFPNLVTDPFGYQEWNVGIGKFMDYIKQVLPIWLKY